MRSIAFSTMIFLPATFVAVSTTLKHPGSLSYRVLGVLLWPNSIRTADVLTIIPLIEPLLHILPGASLTWGVSQAVGRYLLDLAVRCHHRRFHGSNGECLVLLDKSTASKAPQADSSQRCRIAVACNFECSCRGGIRYQLRRKRRT